MEDQTWHIQTDVNGKTIDRQAIAPVNMHAFPSWVDVEKYLRILKREGIIEDYWFNPETMSYQYVCEDHSYPPYVDEDTNKQWLEECRKEPEVIATKDLLMEFVRHWMTVCFEAGDTTPSLDKVAGQYMAKKLEERKEELREQMTSHFDAKFDVFYKGEKL